MIIIWKDPNRRMHGKLHKRAPYYFRIHYGKQRLVYITKPYTDNPTPNQQASREAFTALRREVARQLHDPKLKAKWQTKFKANPHGYKMLHTYVYAMLKRGETLTQSSTSRDALLRISPVDENQQYIKLSNVPLRRNKPESPKCIRTNIVPLLCVYNGSILPIFLPPRASPHHLYNKRQSYFTA